MTSAICVNGGMNRESIVKTTVGIMMIILREKVNRMRLIDADAFIKENAEIIDCEIDHPKYQDTLRELIDEAPTVKQPHGEWEQIGEMTYKCTRCGWLKKIGLMPFCENCGAKMEVGDSE